MLVLWSLYTVYTLYWDTLYLHYPFKLNNAQCPAHADTIILALRGFNAIQKSINSKYKIPVLQQQLQQHHWNQ